MPDPTFAKLYQATATVAAPPLVDIRARARRRTRRQRLIAGGTALTVGAVVASGAAFAADRIPGSGPPTDSGATSAAPSSVPSSSAQPSTQPPGDPSASESTPSRTDTARPLPTTVPTSAMLVPEDIDEYHTIVHDNPQLDEWSIDFLLRFCASRTGAPPPTSAPIANRHRTLEAVSDAPQALDARPVIQRVDLHAGSGNAVDWFEFYRSAASSCGTMTAQRNNIETTVTVLAQNIAGDRSMIVRVTRSDTGTTTHAFVVVGRWFTEFTIPERELSEFQRIVRRAASKLGQ
jgi:hypothetical protein